MEQVTDKHGRILSSPSVLEVLAEQVDRTLGAVIDELTPDEQQWTPSGGVHFSGRWRATQVPVHVKLGMNDNQLYWTQQMAATAPDLVPTLYASDDHLGELPIRWTAMERIQYGPLGPGWEGDEFEMLLEAAVRFQRAAQVIRPEHVSTMDAAMLRRNLEVGLVADPPGPIEKIVSRLESDWAWVASVCTFETCHGDIHMCNALTRVPPPHRSRALLIDCQPVIQPWAFDAAYPQILNSIDRSRIGYTDLVQKMYRLRTEYGMPVCREDDLNRLASIILAWYAIRLWGLTPDRHAIPDYRYETERYITASAALAV